MKYAVSLTFIIVFLSGCASFRRVEVDKGQFFDEHLKMWEAFRLEGIVEIAYRQLRTRKNLNLNMNRDAFTVTVYDSGIFGLRPSPFLNVRIDSTMTFEASDIVSALIDDDLVNLFDTSIDDIHKGFSEMRNNKMQIIREGKIDFNGTRIVFNQRMQIIDITLSSRQLSVQQTTGLLSITSPCSSTGAGSAQAQGQAVVQAQEKEGEQPEPISITMHYDRDDTLDKVFVFHQNRLLFNISVDKMIVGQEDRQALSVYVE